MSNVVEEPKKRGVKPSRIKATYSKAFKEACVEDYLKQKKAIPRYSIAAHVKKWEVPLSTVKKWVNQEQKKRNLSRGKATYSKEFKEECMKDYLNVKKEDPNYAMVIHAKKWRVKWSTFHSWVTQRRKKYGVKPSREHTTYSKAFKEECVKDYLKKKEVIHGYTVAAHVENWNVHPKTFSGWISQSLEKHKTVQSACTSKSSVIFRENHMIDVQEASNRSDVAVRIEDIKDTCVSKVQENPKIIPGENHEMYKKELSNQSEVVVNTKDTSAKHQQKKFFEPMARKIKSEWGQRLQQESQSQKEVVIEVSSSKK